MQIVCSNPFSVLSNKKIRPENPPKKETKDTKPTQRKEAPAKKNDGKKSDAKKEEKKESKVVSLTEASKAEEQKALAKEQEKQEKEAKQERAKTDKHDRSGKAHQVRKEGKGVGGWDDNKVDAEIAEEVIAEETAGEVKEKKKEDARSAEEIAAEAKAREEEAKMRELEEKQMTLEEWQEKQKKENAPPVASFSIRTVDTSAFKGMVAKGKEEKEEVFRIGGSDKSKKAPVKKEEKKDEKKEKVQVDLGFRMDNPARQGKGKGEGKGKGGGGGRGRGGGYQAKADYAPQVDDEKAFPALGATKADAPAEA